MVQKFFYLLNQKLFIYFCIWMWRMDVDVTSVEIEEAGITELALMWWQWVPTPAMIVIIVGPIHVSPTCQMLLPWTQLVHDGLKCSMDHEEFLLLANVLETFKLDKYFIYFGFIPPMKIISVHVYKKNI